MEVASAIPDRQACTYTACYCEENVWKLCERVKETCSDEELKRCHAVFISNAHKQIPLWHQRASKNAQRLVVWDYHVILVVASPGGVVDGTVYDLDTELSFPCRLQEYVEACIGDEALLKINYWRQFRVISAADFLSTFASDRSHMLKEDGTWMAPAPTYPPISTAESTNNLLRFISMEQLDDLDLGTVYDLKEFRQHFLNS